MKKKVKSGEVSMYKKGKSYIKRFDFDDGIESNESHYSYNDWELCQGIQEAIEEDDAICAESKEDLTIVVERGVVILKGKVFCQQDKMDLINKVSAFVGYENVMDEMDVIGEE
jgi:osmotically-inducible protein OsmY